VKDVEAHNRMWKCEHILIHRKLNLPIYLQFFVIIQETLVSILPCKQMPAWADVGLQYI